MAARQPRWPSRLFASGDTPPAIRPIDPAEAGGLHVPWSSRFTTNSLTRHLRANPGYGWVAPESGEYLVAEPWRQRGDIANILEMQARHARAALIERAVTDLAGLGAQAILVAPEEWATRHRLYEERGFSTLEKVVHFQLLGLTRGAPATRPLPPIEPAPVAAHTLDAVLAVDHAAFPWLWWNSAAELAAYRAMPAVQIWLGRTAGVPVAYAGFTILDQWGHLDRLAVDPAWHGRGYGAAMLAWALGRMAAAGVTRVTLSTQETNEQSQRLYRGFGFRQTAEVYTIYGRMVEPA